jgi:hypothetical protein
MTWLAWLPHHHEFDSYFANENDGDARLTRLWVKNGVINDTIDKAKKWNCANPCSYLCSHRLILFFFYLLIENVSSMVHLLLKKPDASGAVSQLVYQKPLDAWTSHDSIGLHSSNVLGTGIVVCCVLILHLFLAAIEEPHMVS